jgi:hypothetical protein
VAAGVLRSDEAGIRPALGKGVTDDERETFLALWLRELHHPNEGTMARYRQRVSQFREGFKQPAPR